MPRRAPLSPSSANSLVVIGRSARVLAEVAREAGHAPWTIDFFGDADTRACAAGVVTLTPKRDFDFRAAELLDALATLQAAGEPMPVVPGSAFERAPRLLARIAARWPTLACDASVFERLRDPPALFAALRASAALRTPTTQWQRPRAQRGWFAKRAGGSGGMHVRRLGEAHARDDYFQRAARGLSVSASFIANGHDCRLVGFAQHLRWHPAPGYRYEGARALARVPRGWMAPAMRIGTALTRALGLRGLWGFDCLRDDAGVMRVVDINPRPPVTLELWSDRARVFDAHLAACATGSLLYSRPRRAREHAHLVLYADSAWRAPVGIDWPRWVADRPLGDTPVPRGAPLCTLLASGADGEEIARTLARRYQRLRRELALERVLPQAINIRSMGG